MLSQAELTALLRSLRDQRVLSVYIDGSVADPALQRSWRLQLDHGLDDIRRWLADSPKKEVAEFETCVATLDDLLSPFDPTVGAPGWVAFITTGGVFAAHALPVTMPTFAAWSTGPCLGPYVRAVKEVRPAIVVLADARKATLYRYSLGEVQRLRTVHAYHPMARPMHMGAPPRGGFHTGTRGSAGHDAAQRTVLTGRNRMVADAVACVTEFAGADDWILVGGIKRVVSRLGEQLESIAPARVLELPALDVHATLADIADAARWGASALREQFDLARVDDIVEDSGAAALGILGPDDTKAALAQTCVREVYLTTRYRDEHAADAENVIRAALDQDASVEEVSGIAAMLLDAYGGVAAGLRFRPAGLAPAVMA